MYRLLAVLVGWTLASTGFCYGADDDFVNCLQVIPERERLTCYDGFARAALGRRRLGYIMMVKHPRKPQFSSPGLHRSEIQYQQYRGDETMSVT